MSIRYDGVAHDVIGARGTRGAPGGPSKKPRMCQNAARPHGKRITTSSKAASASCGGAGRSRELTGTVRAGSARPADAGSSALRRSGE